MAAVTYTQVWSLVLDAVDPNVIMATRDDYPDHIAFVPNDDSNKDWRDYQDWLAEGNAPNPPARGG